MKLKSFVLNEGQTEQCLTRNNMTLICPEKQRPCSDRCPFCHIEEKKIILSCRTSNQYFFIEKDESV